jgi:alkylhydroperoxidase family enzyme
MCFDFRTMPRLAPLSPPFDERTEDSLRRLMGRADVAPLALFRTIAHHPDLLDRFRQIGSTLLSFGSLPAVDRETVIHRVTARCGADYEWGVHAALFAPALGLGADWLQATREGGAPADALLLRAVDELHDDATWSDATHAALAGRYAPDQLVELVCLVGFYHLVSFACRAFDVEPEPWAVAPPT